MNLQSARRVAQPNALDPLRVFVVLSMCFFSGGLAIVFSGFSWGGYSVEGAVEGKLSVQLVGGMIYAISSYRVMRKRHLAIRIARHNWLFTLFLIFIASSCFWSLEPSISVRRVVGVLGTAAFGIFLAIDFSPRQVLRLASYAAAIILLFSFFLILAMPGIGIGVNQGGAIGGFGQKNEFGKAMVVIALIFFASLQGARQPLILWAFLVLAIAGIAASRSGTALSGLLFVVLITYPLLKFASVMMSRIGLGFMALLAASGGVIFLIVSNTFDLLLEALGKDPTLTDRTVIWQLLMPFVLDRATLGYGYGAFWQSDAAFDFIERWRAISHAHNGYLDLWLDVGLVGVIWMVSILLITFMTTSNLYLKARSPYAFFFPAFVSLVILFNVVGRVVPLHNSLNWALLVYCAAAPYSLALRRKTRRPVGAHRGGVHGEA